MLRKKKKSKSIELKIQKNGELIFEGIIYDLPILEKKIIEGSILFFNDPEPCMIHRSAVMSRYYMQMDNFLADIGHKTGNIVDFYDISTDIRVFFDFDKHN